MIGFFLFLFVSGRRTEMTLDSRNDRYAERTWLVSKWSIGGSRDSCYSMRLLIFAREFEKVRRILVGDTFGEI